MTPLVNAGARGAALFGKVPVRPDFVRERFAGPAAQRLDAWLIKAMETLAAAKLTLPPVMVRFLFAAHEEQALIVGVLSPSRDQVGRDFPICVFSSLPLARADGQLTGLPVACAGFFDAAEALIGEAPALRESELLAALDAIPLPDVNALPAASEQARNALRATEATDFVRRTLGDPASSAPYYGLHTFVTACGGAPGRPIATVLDCPLRGDVDLMAWLELAERALQGRTAASAFWIQAPSPRLLVSLGPIPTQLLHFMSDPGLSSARLWPLSTTRADVADQVRATLAPELPALDRPGTTTEQLIAVLAARSRR
jgi:type VI secretion system ImpM family protein